jgi:hypothetical protein
MNIVEHTGLYKSGVTLEEIDNELRLDAARGAPPEPTKEAVLAHSLSKILRMVGAIVIILASATFLFQRWESSDHIMRYFSFLGFTAVLSVAGFLCGLKIREDKGARTFLAIAAALIPINFCALGGLGYSRVLAAQGIVTNYNMLTRWVAPSDGAAIVATVVGCAVLTLLSFISFSALLRTERANLTVLFVASNLFLLIPTRNADWMAFLAVLMFAGLAGYDYLTLRKIPAGGTPEGAIVRAVLAIPFGAMLVRTLCLYLQDLSFFFAGTLFAMAAVFLFQLLPAYLKSASARSSSQTLSLAPVIVSWLCFVAQFVPPLDVDSAALFSLYTLPVSMIIAALSFYCEAGLGTTFRKLAAFVAIVSMAACLVCFPGAVAAFLCIAVSLVILSYGYISESGLVFLSGVGGFGFGVLYHLRYALELYSYSPWLCLSLLGVATVLLSSLIERHYQGLSARLLEIRSKFK